MNTNKKLGNEFEDRCCDMLHRSGYWVHKLTQTEAGQPADLIAVKNKLAYLFDCKRCTNNTFELSRIEPNQITAMKYWTSKENGDALFIIGFDDPTSVFVIPLSYLLGLDKTTLTLKDIQGSDIDFSWNAWRSTH